VVSLAKEVDPSTNPDGAKNIKSLLWNKFDE